MWDLTVPKGQMICLIGRNGVGKTTLLKNIMGLLRPRMGEIRFEGQSLARTTPDKRARMGIGYVPQGREVIPPPDGARKFTDWSRSPWYPWKTSEGSAPVYL